MKFFHFIFILSLNFSLIGQTNYIYLEEIDSLLVYNKFSSFPLYDFNNKMPDGKWVVVDIENSDKYKKNRLKYNVLMSGYYMDSLRHGLFTYNLRCLNKTGFLKIKNKIVVKESIKCYYNYGLLNGHYERRNCEGVLIESGWYTNGNKNGCFVRYFNTGHPSSIVLFQNDTVKNWSYFNEEGYIIKAGNGCYRNKNGIIFIYNNVGILFRTEHYVDNDLVGYIEYQENGSYLKESEGVFKECFDFFPNKIPCITHSIPIDGYIKYFNPISGVLFKTEYFENGFLVNTICH